MDTSLIINSTDTDNNKLQKTITYINPAASNADLKSFAQQAVGLTTNTYNNAKRVNRMDVDEPGGGEVVKPEPNLSVGSFSYDGYRYVADVTYNGDGQLSANSTIATAFCQIYDNNGSPQLRLKANSENFNGTLYAAEGDNFAAKAIQFANP